MSYDISFKVKVEGLDYYISVGDCEANITWNVRKMIEKATGLPWINETNNGKCVDVIPSIEKGYWELYGYPDKYKKYEAKNGWGTVEGTMNFFDQILKDWKRFKEWYPELAEIATFWIE